MNHSLACTTQLQTSRMHLFFLARSLREWVPVSESGFQSQRVGSKLLEFELQLQKIEPVVKVDKIVL